MGRYKMVYVELSLRRSNPNQDRTSRKTRHISPNHPVLIDWKRLDQFEEWLCKREDQLLTESPAITRERETPEKR